MKVSGSHGKRTIQERGGYFRNVSSETELGTFFCERFFYLHMEFITSSTVSSFICFFPVTEGSRRVLAMTELWRVAFLRYFRAALLPIDAFLSSHGSFSFQTKYKELFGNYYFWNYLNVQYRMFNI